MRVSNIEMDGIQLLDMECEVIFKVITECVGGNDTS
jgi:hypothetical protein